MGVGRRAGVHGRLDETEKPVKIGDRGVDVLAVWRPGNAAGNRVGLPDGVGLQRGTAARSDSAATVLDGQTVAAFTLFVEPTLDRCATRARREQNRRRRPQATLRGWLFQT